MSIYLYSRRVLTEAQLASIGAVAVESTYCEYMVETVIWFLAGLDDEHGRAFTFGMSMHNRLELMRTLGLRRLADQEEIAKFTAIVAELKEASTERNAIIHGDWTTEGDPLEVGFKQDLDPNRQAVAIKIRKNSPPMRFPSHAVEDTARRLSKARIDFYRFVLEIWPDEFIAHEAAMAPDRTSILS